MTTSVFIFVEEQSSAQIIRALARTMGLEKRVRILEHQGVGELKKSINTKIGAIIDKKVRFIVLRDQDSGDCIKLKRELNELVPNSKRSKTKIRIACRELEAWYIAQPEALKKAKVLNTDIPNALLKRDPDRIENPKEEVIKRCHKTGQMWLANSIGQHLDPRAQKSQSFCAFIDALQALADD